MVNKAPIVLCELLFDDSMVAQIKKFKRVLVRFCHENTKAQKYFMGGFEKTVELRRDKLLAKVPVILKVLYDEDIIDEESILDWAKKVGGLGRGVEIRYGQGGDHGGLTQCFVDFDLVVPLPNSA